MKFLDALRKAKLNSGNVVIPDIKVFSPKDGELMGGRRPADYAAALVRAGAPVISVVTEEKEFHGSLEMLKEIAGAVDVPILRKDFIHTREDLIETKEAGASAILLMCSCLSGDELQTLYRQALELGIDPFVETHNEEDFELVNELGAELVGINNRDILKLERDDGDVNRTVSLAGLAPDGAFLVTESSIKNPQEVRTAIRSGADAALVGTAIALAPDAEMFYRMLASPTCLKVCGLMKREDIETCIECGVERIGMVCEYPVYVPWSMDRERVCELRNDIPKGFTSVVVTGGDSGKILEIARSVRPDMMQLHYKEGADQLKGLVPELKKMGISVIKTVPVSPEDSLEQFGTDDMENVIRQLEECGVDELLVDPRHGANAERMDLKADEDLFKKILEAASIPVILAGGLNTDNIRDSIDRTGAESVDVMTGSEDSPGRKNKEKIRFLAGACRN